MPNRLQPALTVVNYFTCATAEPWPAHSLWNLDVIQAVCRACTPGRRPTPARRRDLRTSPPAVTGEARRLRAVLGFFLVPSSFVVDAPHTTPPTWCPARPALW